MFLCFSFYFVTLTEPKATTRRTRGQGTPCPPFRPARPPGVYIEDCKTRSDTGEFLRPVDFLKLFFTPCLIGMLCTYTNDYANTVGPQKPSLYQLWSNTYPEEFYCFIGLLMYMSTVHTIIVFNTLCKTNKWWKTLFYHFLDTARVNAFILFEDFRKKHADIPELQRPDRYGQLDFTTELIRQLADLDVHADVPLV